MAEKKYLGWNFIDNKWEEVTKEVYDSLLDPARCVAPQSPDLEREGKELLEKFRFGSHGEDQHLYAKQCAIIHLELLIKALKSIFGQDEDKQPDIVYYTKLIEQINKL